LEGRLVSNDRAGELVAVIADQPDRFSQCCRQVGSGRRWRGEELQDDAVGVAEGEAAALPRHQPEDAIRIRRHEMT
jgi:hypothetical protein